MTHDELDDALVSCLRGLISWLQVASGISESDAYALCSMAASFRVTQFAHQTASAYSSTPPKAVHGMVPKSVFPKGLQDRIGSWLRPADRLDILDLVIRADLTATRRDVDAYVACFTYDAEPPELPAHLRLSPIAGGAAVERHSLTSSDGTEFSVAIAESPSGAGHAGVVILPDVRGLYDDTHRGGARVGGTDTWYGGEDRRRDQAADRREGDRPDTLLMAPADGNRRAGRQVPHLDRSALHARRQPGAVRGEGHRQDRVHGTWVGR